MKTIGRRKLYTDVREVTRENIIKVITDVMADFEANANDCDRLLQIEAGNMPLTRVKVVRPEIDIQTVDNLPHEIAEFKESFHWGNSILLVQRGIKDSGTSDEMEAISLLNEFYCAENIGTKQKALGHFVEITGIGYTYVNVKPDWVDGDSLFELETLDPRFAFVVRSALYTDHRIVLGVTFRQDKEGNKFYTAFTDKYRFDIANLNVVATSMNIIGRIPIIEWERSTDRMGVFEREIKEIQRLNIIASDIANNIDGDTQMIWWANNVEFAHKKDENGIETDEIDRPKSGEWIMTQTTRDQSSPSIKPLTTNYDYNGLLNSYSSSRALVLERCYTPQRNDNVSGSSGIASADASGWSAAEQVASAQQLLMESSKLEEVKIALAVVKASDARLALDSPLRKLRYIDCRPKIIRQKTYEMSVKATAFATYVSHGVNGLHALRMINAFEDVNQTWEDSKEIIEMYQRKAFGENEAIKPTSDDPINQITRSPLVDGMSLQEPVKDGGEE